MAWEEDHKFAADWLDWCLVVRSQVCCSLARLVCGGQIAGLSMIGLIGVWLPDRKFVVDPLDWCFVEGSHVVVDRLDWCLLVGSHVCC